MKSSGMVSSGGNLLSRGLSAHPLALFIPSGDISKFWLASASITWRIDANLRKLYLFVGSSWKPEAVDSFEDPKLGWYKADLVRRRAVGAINTIAPYFSPESSFPGPLSWVCEAVVQSSTYFIHNMPPPATDTPQMISITPYKNLIEKIGPLHKQPL